jgi:Zn-dependent metalloprotease
MLAAVPGVVAGRRLVLTQPDRLPGASGSAFVVQENLGVVVVSSPTSLVTSISTDPERVKKAASSTLKEILKGNCGFSGSENLLPVDRQPIWFDGTDNTAHIRYKQLVDGLPLEGASIAIHFRTKTGAVYAVNGEVHSQAAIDGAVNDTTSTTTTTTTGAEGTTVLTCEDAIDAALQELGLRDPAVVEAGTWEGECQPAAVQGRDGKPYLAYKRLYRYQPTPSSVATENLTVPEQLDWIYAQRSTGRLVAVRPTIFSDRTMETRNCRSKYVYYPFQCFPVTTSPDKIKTGDEQVDNVHNFTVDVYDMYVRMFQFAGMDGQDMNTLSLAHYGANYSNAFFDSEEGYLAYGDGDGVVYGQFGQMDVGRFD